MEHCDSMMLSEFLPVNQDGAVAQPQRQLPAGPAGVVNSGGVQVGNAAVAPCAAMVVPPPAPLGQSPAAMLAQTLLCAPGATPTTFAAKFSSGAAAQGLVLPSSVAAQFQAQAWSAPGIMTPAPGRTVTWLPARHEVPLWSIHPGAPKMDARERQAFEYRLKITQLLQGLRLTRNDGMVPEGGPVPPF